MVHGAAEIGSRHDPRAIGSCDLRCGVRRGDVWLHHCWSACERTQALKLARAVMPTKQPRTHGADDRLFCPECGGEMTLIQRTRDPAARCIRTANIRVRQVPK